MFPASVPKCSSTYSHYSRTRPNMVLVNKPKGCMAIKYINDEGSKEPKVFQMSITPSSSFKGRPREDQ